MTRGADIQISDDIEFQGLSDHPHAFDRPDPLLVDLVRLADTLDVEHGISLTLGGSLITGTLFSGYRFYEAQAAAVMAGSVVGSGSEDAAEAYRKNMVAFYTARMNLYQPQRLLSGESKYVPLYIHVHNAKWIGNDGMFSGATTLWRGRIAVVGGFAVSQV